MPEQLMLTRQCLVCMRNLFPPDFETWDFENVCDQCYDDCTLVCDLCDTRVLNIGTTVRDALVRGADFVDVTQGGYWTVEGDYACDDCAHSCDECDQLHSGYDAAIECCYDAENSNDTYGTIHSYSWTPSEYKFWSATTSGPATVRPTPGVLYVGMELEMERVSNNIPEFLEMTGEDYHNPSFSYFKYDGSLNDNGAELVTMPCTPQVFEQVFPWDALNKLHQMGGRAWQMGSCGMHFHLSRSAFSRPHLWKFISWHYHNRSVCVDWAGRDSRQWSSWYNTTMENMGQKPSDVAKRQPGQIYGERYSAININPQHTIELRYFRGNMLRSGIMRNVQFIDAIFEYTKRLTVQDVVNKKLTFANLVEFMVADAGRYQYAINYAAHLNVNNKYFNNNIIGDVFSERIGD